MFETIWNLIIFDQTALRGFSTNHPTFKSEEEKLELLSKIKVNTANLRLWCLCSWKNGHLRGFIFLTGQESSQQIFHQKSRRMQLATVHWRHLSLHSSGTLGSKRSWSPVFIDDMFFCEIDYPWPFFGRIAVTYILLRTSVEFFSFHIFFLIYQVSLVFVGSLIFNQPCV